MDFFAFAIASQILIDSHLGSHSYQCMLLYSSCH